MVSKLRPCEINFFFRKTNYAYKQSGLYEFRGGTTTAHTQSNGHARVKVLLIDEALDLRLLELGGGLMASGQVGEERSVLATGQRKAVEQCDYTTRKKESRSNAKTQNARSLSIF